MENLKTHMEHSRLKGLFALVLIMIIVALGAYSFLTLREAKYLVRGEATISVSGGGEVFAKPDIATFSFSVRAEGDDAGSAQEKSALAVNEIIEYLKSEEIDEKDIKTQYYNLNPQYDYVRSVCNKEGFCPPGKQVLRGYEVSQTIEVKVRDVDEAGNLISGVGTLGATNVSSLRFTIDDEEELIAEAREKAIEDAKEKAEELADDLGVSLVRVVNFYEEGGGRGGEYPAIARAESLSFDGVDDAVAPDIPIGENTFISRVNIAYEIR